MSFHTLILLEGETEEEFFKALGDLYLKGIPKTYKNMRGNFNVNNKIVDKIIQFSTDNPGKEFDVYICVDQEREGDPAYNEEFVFQETSTIGSCLEINGVIANIMMESLFFIDIDGLYKFLRTPNNRRNAKKYTGFRKLTHRDLTRLFKQNKKMYHKGRRCQSLVNNIDLNKIYNTAEEIKYFIDNIKKRHKEKK